jgi:hypothetical protein
MRVTTVALYIAHPNVGFQGMPDAASLAWAAATLIRLNLD